MFSGVYSMRGSPLGVAGNLKNQAFSRLRLWLSRFFYGLVSDQSENLPRTAERGLCAIRCFHRLIVNHRKKHCQTSENLQDFWWNRHLLTCKNATGDCGAKGGCSVRQDLLLVRNVLWVEKRKLRGAVAARCLGRCGRKPGRVLTPN